MTIKKVFIKRRTRGFTLIETFVAVVLLMTALAGALSLASQGFNSADVAGDQITASFLAQDAVEYVRYLRDTSNLNGDGWLAELSECISNDGSKACFFDSSQPYRSGNNNPQDCNGTCPLMYYDNTDGDNGFYNYVNVPSGYNSITNRSVGTDNIKTKFTRTVSIQNPVCDSSHNNCENTEAQVTAIVSWLRGNQQHSVVLKENIFDWEP